MKPKQACRFLSTTILKLNKKFSQMSLMKLKTFRSVHKEYQPNLIVVVFQISIADFTVCEKYI